MRQSWILVQVSEDKFSQMADDLKYIGQTTFRGSCNYEVPNEGDSLVVYSGFNDGNLFPLFIAKVNRTFLKDKSNYICFLSIDSKVVRIDKEFADYELRYCPSCKTDMTELIDDTLVGKIWDMTQNAPLLVAWN